MNVPKLRFKEFNDDWNLIRLGDCCNLITKGTTPNRFSESGIKFIKIESLINKKIDNNKCLYVDEKTHITSLKRSVLEEKDVLFAIAGATIGKCGIIEKENLPSNTNQALAILRANHKKLNPYFLLNVLDSNIMKKYILLNISVGAQPNLNLEQINNFKFKLPSGEEQLKVANFLSLLDKKIELQTKKIEDLKLFKLSKYSLVFSKSNNKIKLSDICIIEKGKQINSDLLIEKGNYYMLNGGILPSGYLNEYNTNENTITISEGGNSCGYINFNKTKFWCGGHCYKIISSSVNTSYLYHLLKHNEKIIMDLRVGSGLPNIQKKDLEALKLSIHKNDEQLKIGILFDTFDKKINLEINKLNKFKELKKALMQVMFV